MQRANAKAASRQKVIEAARILFASSPYEETTIRSIARFMGQSTGLVFSHFPDKETIWRAAMGTPPPTDSPLTRAAPELLVALQALLVREAALSPGTDDLRDAAQRAVQAAMGLRPPASGFPPTDLLPTFESFGGEVLAEARGRAALPSFRGVMEPVFSLCQLLVAQAAGKASAEEVHAAAVAAGATIAQVAVHRAQDVPSHPAATPSTGRPPHGAAPTATMRQAG